MVDPSPKELLVELKDIFKDVSSQNKRDNVLTLNDLPYFGIDPAADAKKWIIPLEECVQFLDMVEKQTEDVDFSEKGRIRVLKTHLLGNAQNYWKGFRGDSWGLARAFLLARYPDINDYDSYMDKVRALKRKPDEQMCNYATRVEDAWDKLQKEAGGTMSDAQILKDKKSTLIAACPAEIKNFVDVTSDAVTYAMALKGITSWLERNKQYK